VLQQFPLRQPLDEYPDGSDCRIDGGIRQAETAEVIVEGFLNSRTELSSSRWGNVQKSLYIQTVVIDGLGVPCRGNGGQPFIQQGFQILSVSFLLFNQSVKSILCLTPEGPNYLLSFFLGELVVVLF
jgi:hypothetical protein